MPRGLLGRSLLIVLVPLVVVQAVALQVFYGTHMNIVSRRLSAAIAGEAQKALGSERVHVGTLDEAIAAKGHAPASFDLVTLWDVIEHVPDPQALLRTIRGLIKPGGKLLLAAAACGIGR